MIPKLEEVQQMHFAEYVVAVVVNHVILLISNLILWFHGVCHIPRADTIIGKVYMGELDGKDFSVLLSLIQSRWVKWYV